MIQGTWFSARWVLTNNEGRVESSAGFNYDDESAWSRPIDAANYADDLEDFPREGSWCVPADRWRQVRASALKNRSLTPLCTRRRSSG